MRTTPRKSNRPDDKGRGGQGVNVVGFFFLFVFYLVGWLVSGVLVWWRDSSSGRQGGGCIRVVRG